MNHEGVGSGSAGLSSEKALNKETLQSQYRARKTLMLSLSLSGTEMCNKLQDVQE